MGDQEYNPHKEYSVTEVAYLLGIGVEAVRRRIADGRLKARKEGRGYRISDQALQEYKRRSDT